MRERALKQRSVVLMIVLVFVTLGFYYPLWFLRRRRALNALDSPRKLPAWPFVLMLAFLIAMFLVGFVVGAIAPGRRLEDVIGSGPAFALLVARLAVGLLVLFQCFRIKDILEDHLAGPEGSQRGMMLSTQIQLSGLMTFFFTIFYLQHVINRDVIPMQLAAA